MWRVRKEHGRQGCIEYINSEYTNVCKVVVSKQINHFSEIKKCALCSSYKQSQKFIKKIY